jgi:hypothetical protein
VDFHIRRPRFSSPFTVAAPVFWLPKIFENVHDDRRGARNGISTSTK